MKGKGRLYAIITMVLAIVAIMAIIAVRTYNKPHRQVATETPAFTMKASELVEDFLADEARANADYSGKIVQLEGTLKEIVRNDSSLILVMGDTVEMIGVSAYLQQDEEVEGGELQPGEVITVKGICDGMLLDVIIGNAILIRDKEK